MEAPNRSPLPMLGELIIERHFQAPVEKVWQAWTAPESIQKWWGPQEYSAQVSKNDLRVGGKFLYSMRGPDGKDVWSTGIYQEIIPMKKIIITDSFSDEKGNIVPASSYGMEAPLPLELLVTITFSDDHGHTDIKLVHSGLPVGDQLNGSREGWQTSLDKLENLLISQGEAIHKTELRAEPGESSVEFTHMFDQSPDVVFRLLTDGMQIPLWWGQEGSTLTVDQYDPREGGLWRFIETDKDGRRFGFHGVFHEVTSPDRMVYSMEFEGMPGHVSFVINTLENVEGMTRFNQKYLFESPQDRDQMMSMDMRRSEEESIQRFENLINVCCPEVF